MDIFANCEEVQEIKANMRNYVSWRAYFDDLEYAQAKEVRRLAKIKVAKQPAPKEFNFIPLSEFADAELEF